MDSTAVGNALAGAVGGDADVAKQVSPPAVSGDAETAKHEPPKRAQTLVSDWAEIIDPEEHAKLTASLAVAAKLYPHSQIPFHLWLNSKAAVLAKEDPKWVLLDRAVKHNQCVKLVEADPAWEGYKKGKSRSKKNAAPAPTSDGGGGSGGDGGSSGGGIYTTTEPPAPQEKRKYIKQSVLLEERDDSVIARVTEKAAFDLAVRATLLSRVASPC